MQDWFERIAGCKEQSYAETQSLFDIVEGHLVSRANDRRCKLGALELVFLGELRTRNASNFARGGRELLQERFLSGDVRAMHSLPENKGALFQAASQFNLLEMVQPDVTPEVGVTGYAADHTQGPACAIAAGAGTIYRNYFVPVGGGVGQTAQRQLDGLRDLGDALAEAIGVSVSQLWDMKNGYALCSRSGLDLINQYLAGQGQNRLDDLRSLLRIGVHWDVEVTDIESPEPHLVTQAYCSALPISYCHHPTHLWEPFARLILEAAYEAVFHVACLNGERGVSNRLLLTRLGGGAFGNPDEWIDDAIARAKQLFSSCDIEMCHVTRT